MCGIVGFVDKSIQGKALINKMLQSIAHRGPDGAGSIQIGEVTLGHRRLSIIDLDTGDQPMVNENRTLCIVYNGEIYNYQEIKKNLIDKGYSFKTNSDTEVILNAYDAFGKKCLELFNGIFAFAIYDTVNEELFLARDHFGIKPLHYYYHDGVFVFASEQKAILDHPKVTPHFNRQALHLQINLRYTQGDETLFSGIKRLPPAHFISFKNGKLNLKAYWNLNPKINHSISEKDAIDGLHHYLQQAIKRQLVSDVPIGVYLSGGLDSSTIVQKMDELGVENINTFTLGFNEPTDEFPDAKRIADHFHTNHRVHSLDLNPLSAMEKVIWHAEEPKINLLQGFEMSKFVQPHVKVILGGLGGDELFAGYDIHKFIYPSRNFHSRIPFSLQKLFRWKADFLFALQNKTKSFKLDEYRRGIQMLLSIGKIEKYYLIIRNVWDFDQGQWNNIYSEKYLSETKAKIPQTVEWFKKYFIEAKYLNPLDQVLFSEFQSKMVNDYLLVDDRMSMAHSIEERVPFLDRDLVDFGFSIPIELKMLNGQTKGLFRKAMEPYLPKKIVKKKKWGFTVNPYHQFNKDLKKRIEKELTKQYIVDEGIFNYEYIRNILDYPSHPKLRWHYNYLWVLLGLKIWKEQFKVEK